MLQIRLMLNRSRLLIILMLFLLLSCEQHEPGRLHVGFDLDDTLIYSRYLFENAPRDEDGHLDYAWINSHDKNFSELIDPTVELIRYFRAHGHKVFFHHRPPSGSGGSGSAFSQRFIGI